MQKTFLQELKIQALYTALGLLAGIQILADIYLLGRWAGWWGWYAIR